LFLLVTGVRDEEKFLPGLLESVKSQTLKPALWVIVDNESRDNSAAIIAQAAEENDWIELFQVPADEEYGLFSHSVPLHAGFKEAVSRAARKNIPYRYLGVLDADILLEEAYYEKLVQYMEDSPDLGITSGRLCIVDGEKVTPEFSGEQPRGPCRLYRREYLEAIGGTVPVSPNWDTDTDVLAELRGWRIAVLDEARAIHRRPTHTRKGLLRGYFRRGKCFHYANHHPLSATLTGIYFGVHPPFLTGIVFLLGYFYSLVRRSEQTPNPEIREYFWNNFKRQRKKIKNKVAELVFRRKNNG